ncbi:basic secretory peptidase family protein [Kribbella voronezhensis]|uniref:Basic secretory peptidase family protein n=1 Tax=Kribbella voronezhensis TaxID=2512212 RepID=A0A4R7T434_9ACTN|nr:basic secretory protein-like protein [Kribbella voronezhensis]TDU86561.1 basic secretory peptidase family protein [Kribbella voronezhensis]
MTKRGRIVAGVAALAVASAGGVVVATRGGHGAPPSGSTAVAVEATPGASSEAEKAARKGQLNVLLALRATAVQKGDQKAFLAAVDPAQPALVRSQRTLFTNLRKFAFTKLTYFVESERGTPALVTKYGPSTVSVRLMMRYQLAALDSAPVQTDLGYTFTRRGDHWVLVSDNALDSELSGDGHQQPWDFGEIAVTHREKVVVVVDKAEAALGAKIAKNSEGAVEAVRRHWPRPWDGSVMVVAMHEPRVMSMLWTTGTGAGWTIAAKAVGLYDGEPFRVKTGAPIGSRIVVNPAFRQSTDEDLLVHEMTHVATDSMNWRTPEWLVEGVAEYVRCRAIEDDPHWTVDPYRKEVRAKYLPSLKALPSSADFDANSNRSYGVSWWATEYLAAKLGTKKLAALYADLSVHNTTPVAYTAIIKHHTGKSPAALAAAVKSWRG